MPLCLCMPPCLCMPLCLSASLPLCLSASASLKSRLILNTNLRSVKHVNSTFYHCGVMAQWQMRGMWVDRKSTCLAARYGTHIKMHVMPTCLLCPHAC